jgi:hypothetical protein
MKLKKNINKKNILINGVIRGGMVKTLFFSFFVNNFNLI